MAKVIYCIIFKDFKLLGYNNTSTILKNPTKDEVQINFSPIIAYRGWLEEYRELFKKVKELNISNLSCECIFLTHEYNKHLYNEINYPEAEKYLWVPKIQEDKVSQYGSNTIRYKWQLKNTFIESFKKLLKEELPDMTIRYIF